MKLSGLEGFALCLVALFGVFACVVESDDYLAACLAFIHQNAASCPDALANARTHQLVRLPFDEAGIEYSDGYQLEAHREESSEENCLSMLLRDPSGVDEARWKWPHHGPELTAAERRELHLVRRRVLGPWSRLGEDSWENRFNGDVASGSELEALLGVDLGELLGAGPPALVADFVSQKPVYFIETQRLLSPHREEDLDDSSDGRRRRKVSPSLEDTVSQYARDMKAKLNATLVYHSQKSQELDQSFPKRLLDRDVSSASVDEADIRARYEAQRGTRRRLEELRLTPEGADLPLPSGNLDRVKLDVLDLYLSDSEAKLDSFEEILEKVDLLKEVVNKRFLRKRLVVDAETGLSIRRDSDDQQIDPAVLSSGEKHELVMFYDMIFSAKPGALVLIDEPEISLHVSWQRQFLDDISRVADLTSIRALIATHSPQIIGTHTDKTQELGYEVDLRAM